MRKESLWIFFIIPLILGPLVLNMIGVTTAQETHDIAVTSVTPSQTSVRLGELVNVTVIVENQGTVNETNFNVTVYYDATVIETKTVQNLEAGASTSLTFTWNTNTTVIREEVYAETKRKKTYFINATASLLSDTDTTDNTLLSNSTVTIISYYITVIPQSIMDTNLTPDKNFTVSIYTDYNGTDISSWQFQLSYNPLVLHGVKVTNGDLISQAKDSSARYNAGTFNNTLGTLSLTMAYFLFTAEPAPLTYGPGILANVTFTVVGNGTSDITLDIDPATINRKAELKGYTEEGSGAPYNIIDYHTPDQGHILDGFFQNIEAVTRDIAVTNITLSTTSAVKGELVNITVVVENQGTVAETFDVEVYYDYDPSFPGFRRIETETVTNLSAGANKSLTFTWNTTEVMAGNYTITAVVSELSGETDTEDNTLQSDETVTVKAREEQPLPILPIIIGIVAVVVLVVVVYAVRRR